MAYAVREMRLVNVSRLQLVELTATPRGLIEAISDLSSFHGQAEVGRPRRLVSEQVRQAGPGLVGATLEAVRADELLEEGWTVIKSDAHLFSAVSHLSPWRDWLQARDHADALAGLWRGWLRSSVLEDVVGRVVKVVPTLATLFVRTSDVTFECTLPLDATDLPQAPPALAPLLRTHARIRAMYIFAGGSNAPRVQLEAGWTARGYRPALLAPVEERITALLNGRAIGWPLL
jgi:hypothetical protein